MDIFGDKRKRKLLIITASILATLLVIFIACAIYLGDYYRADEGAMSAFAPLKSIEPIELDDGSLVFARENARAGLIFYPGGKVEHRAYAPLMAALAEEGVFCVLVKMPFNLAVFDVNAADGIKELYPEIESWYIGGHSLGGSMAASYLEAHSEELDGLILLGSYSTADLSGTDLSVLSVFGSEDGVMNREKYEANKKNLPKDTVELVIDGGNHAGFGMYGEQDGDGSRAISTEDQIYATALAIAELILGTP